MKGNRLLMSSIYKHICLSLSPRVGYVQMREALMAHKIPESDIDKIFADIDIDMSGSIRYTEFIAASMERRMYLDRETLIHAFEKYVLIYRI